MESILIMSISIITDTTCDISKDEWERLKITVLPLTVRFDDEAFLDVLEIDTDTFFSRLEKSKKLPSTSLIPPAVFEEAFKNELDKGNDVIAILLSSQMSGTYNSALIAKQMLGSDNIYIVDSRNVTFGLGLLVYEAIRLRDIGFSAKEIFEKIEECKSRVQVLAILGDLKYVKMGGRLSATSAFFANILNIRPIVEVNFKMGQIHVYGKARGIKACMEYVNKEILKLGIDEERQVIVANASAKELENQFVESIRRVTDKELIFGRVGSAVGAYCGPNSVGISFFKKIK